MREMRCGELHLQLRVWNVQVITLTKGAQS